MTDPILTDLQPPRKQQVRDVLRTGAKYTLCAIAGAAVATAAFVGISGWPKGPTTSASAVSAPAAPSEPVIVTRPGEAPRYSSVNDGDPNAPIYAPPAGLKPAMVNQ